MAPPKVALTYPKTPATKANRLNERVTYDTTAIHTLVNSTPLAHVSFCDPFNPTHPAILPMIAVMASFHHPSSSLSDPLDIYLHAHLTSRFIQLSSLSTGLPVTISATSMDGLVLSLTPFSHSYNYRSAILIGTAHLVNDETEKMWALERFTEKVLPGRWDRVRVPPTDAEMKSTGVVRVTVESASCKTRVGGPGEERRDELDEEVRGRVWTGVVPTWLTMGEAVPAGENRVEKVPEYIDGFVKGWNQREEGYAVAAAGMERIKKAKKEEE